MTDTVLRRQSQAQDAWAGTLGTVRPRRRPNAELRSREHLTETEVERLVQAAKGNRWGHRDSTMILVAWRHGLRCPNWLTCVGTKSILSAPRCMSVAPRARA